MGQRVIEKRERMRCVPRAFSAARSSLRCAQLESRDTPPPNRVTNVNVLQTLGFMARRCTNANEKLANANQLEIKDLSNGSKNGNFRRETHARRHKTH